MEEDIFQNWSQKTPRRVRLDAPGALDHVVVSGIERGKIANGEE